MVEGCPQWLNLGRKCAGGSYRCSPSKASLSQEAVSSVADLRTSSCSRIFGDDTMKGFLLVVVSKTKI